ncbi:diaminopimelate epimerase [Flammeovirga pectinis]|uniref:Diaminopimelate epimerase n=1 Tax=Flammeovirga pectinis TaxID=2494373 RepID=A0A3Q9FKL8_9BACT|nr:diaminopimelate epimerase [Flammeovirga pectinis]AZQ60739.1 diaminopimelate epimerase [Flammeovirga pectinis]
MINFWKYQGAGNDFIMIDDRNNTFNSNDFEKVAFLCHRRFGIGADGLILIRLKEGYDFEMVYFNADGHLGSMCGNGGRCAVRFAHTLGLFENKTSFWAADGAHEATLDDKQLVHLLMNPPGEIEVNNDHYFMDTGSPHYVRFENDLANFDCVTEGKAIRHNERFNEEGTNVNFAQVTGKQSLDVRTFERGVEDETYACGTGVTACAIAANIEHDMQSPIQVKVLGGQLAVGFTKVSDKKYTDIILTGPATPVFNAEIEG